MNICPKHWELIRAAVTAKGLDPLVSANGRDAAARLAAELIGVAEADDFDPLMFVTLAIYNKGLQLGAHMLFADVCVICEAVRRHPNPCPHGCTAETYEQWWIDGPTSAALEVAQERGLVPR